MERKNINEIVMYYLKKIKEWRDKLIKDESYVELEGQDNK